MHFLPLDISLMKTPHEKALIQSFIEWNLLSQKNNKPFFFFAQIMMSRMYNNDK